MAAVIVAIASPGDACTGSLVAQNLAVLLARARRKVLLLDTTPDQRCLGWGRQRAQARLRPWVTASPACEGLGGRLERVRHHFDDIVIDMAAADNHPSRCALIAAQVAVVALVADKMDGTCQSLLIGPKSDCGFIRGKEE